MNLTDPDEIKRLRLTEEENRSRNRKKKRWIVFLSRFVVDLKKIPYESLKDLVAVENLHRGNTAQRPTPTIQSTIEGAARCLHSQQLPVYYAEGGGGYDKSLFLNF